MSFWMATLTRYRILLTLCCWCLPVAGWAGVDLVQVDKSDRQMRLLDGDEVVATYSISLGGSPQGHKTQEGDQKTPEGQYVLDYKNESSSYYRSMHVSYPNEADTQQATERGVSPGGFIMVHGQRNGFGWLAPVLQHFDWTDGCIAITNAEMDEFMSLVSPGTPIDIRW
ncbi:L,D-transpeptidase family protein [Spongiibacter tropicus]|uniref:L,D-transpeptidase family protein n=1 Tax=Spongiibacter tropicus TaxID=454602 RepID=UPI0023548D5F|nr:L,D-transpeptidase family protein [Spongiibacter tropicus]|tara:strand:- start:145 stop:651 length:507 start_codon:yes stop_codon:yes gene_type:complete